MNINRTARIASIIEKRRPLAQKIEGVEANLKSLASALRNLEDNRNQLLKRVDDPNVIGQLKEIDFSSIQLIEEESKKLNTLRKRLSRPTLNIGVVGLMGQGKSTLLKSLSGLTDNEIPAYEGGACTAVRSTIENKDGMTRAEVTLHSEQSFLEEVIWLYYDKLGFTDKPTSLDDFANKPFPEQPPSGATDEETYKRLREDYHYNIERYRELLTPGTVKTLQIRNEEIPDYVIQKRDKDRGLTTFKHLAVREVKIFCPFKNSDVGKIALVDVPGLGDTKLGDEELMLKTLGQEVDVVLFIRRPDPQRYQWQAVDTQLYDTAAKALNNLAGRSFMVLNHSVRTDNLRACKALQSSIDTIKVVRCEVGDCSNSDDANRVFDLVLDYLANNIEFLDKDYAKSCQESLIPIQTKVKIELDKARTSLSKEAQQNKDAQLFVPLFNQLWKNLRNGLQELLQELRKQRDEVDTNFKAKVDEAIQRCREDTGIPSIEEIEIQARSTGGYPNAYYQYLPEVRAHLSHKFLSLDEGLKLSLEQVKSQVAEVLINQGRLGGLTKARGSELIREMAKLLPEQLIPGEPSKLKFGFQLLAEFELSYRGFVQHRIRQHLDGLTPNEPATLQLSTSPSAQQVFLNLKTAHAKAVYNCENALENLLCEPSQAAFAIVEEFLDRILRAEDVDSEWRIFLDDVRSEVWPDEFKQLNERTRMRREWLDAVERVAEINESNSMQFLN
jgi:energy-coupling factor transporter ATP-binding protein EcfA2